VWNIEYRRVGQTGGGYPGTFLDAANAADMLRKLAPKYHLDLGHVVAVGHSAGGHLALWDAARGHLPAASPLHRSDPLKLRGAISLSGIPDLAAYRADGPAACGGPQTIDALVGNRAHPYADTSPSELLPLGVPQVVVSGSEDPIVPPRFAHAYVAKARRAGDKVEDIEIAGAGHFEMIDPNSAAWPMIEAAITRLER
jgi:acetyl esterase/lipase